MTHHPAIDIPHTAIISAKLQQIVKDLDELRNPTNHLFETAEDKYVRIYRNLGIIKGLVT